MDKIIRFKPNLIILKMDIHRVWNSIFRRTGKHTSSVIDFSSLQPLYDTNVEKAYIEGIRHQNNRAYV